MGDKVRVRKGNSPPPAKVPKYMLRGCGVAQTTRDVGLEAAII